jgi:hypothetical protein
LPRITLPATESKVKTGDRESNPTAAQMGVQFATLLRAMIFWQLRVDGLVRCRAADSVARMHIRGSLPYLWMKAEAALALV